MAEAAATDEHTNGRLCKPPNRKKYEEDVAQCNSAIQSKESQLKFVIRECEKLQLDLDRLKSDKSANTERRQAISNDLAKINQDISKQEAESARLQSGLQYRSEARINEAISRLQHQLRMQNFKLNEEKKIVAEIDMLGRSRKDLGVYLLAKKQLEEKRSQARSLREQRDKMHRTGKTMMQRDEQLRRDISVGHEQAELLRREIADDRCRLKDIMSEFSEQEKSYEEQRRRHIAQQQRVKKEERKAAAEAQQQEIAVMKASCDPYTEQKTLCLTLSNYLRRHYGIVTPPTSTDDADQHPAVPMSVSPVDSPSTLIRDAEPAGMYRLCKKLADDDLRTGVPRSKPMKKPRKEKRKMTMTHTPQIFAQFSQLGLSAPMTRAEVDVSLQQLSAMQEHYDCLSHADNDSPTSLAPLLSLQLAACDTNATPSSAASFTCSAPTTPDVQIDTIRLTATPDSSGRRRKMSCDSGACELEDVARCLIDSSSPTHGQRQSVTSPSGSDTTVTLPDSVIAADSLTDIDIVSTIDSDTVVDHVTDDVSVSYVMLSS